MYNFFKKYWLIILILLFLLAFTLFFLVITPEALVEKVGVRNTYIITFLLATFGGLSTITGTSFFLSVAAFSSGGADPFLLGIFGGLGIFISDSIFFLAARYGVRTFKVDTKPAARWMVSKIERLSENSILGIVYLYLGFLPLPNDILMIALALIGMPYKRLAPVLAAGSFTIVTVSAYLGEALFAF